MLINEKLKLVPTNPGCYLYKDKENKIIYVGKAKNLKNRVKSYFSGSHNLKTQKLVSNIVDIEWIITDSELDALVLELNLIKQHNPKYNILLTDDKSYPYIEITNHTHPRLIVKRNVTNKEGQLFGPYPNVSSARESVKILNKLYPLRKCVNIPKKECLYFHLNQCLAPCINDINSNQYDEYLKKIKTFLKGNIKDVKTFIENSMYKASEAMDFETAKEYKELLDHINQMSEKQSINLNDFIERDIIGYSFDENDIAIVVFYYRGGKIVSHEIEVFGYIDSPIDTFKSFVIQTYLDERTVKPKELLLPNFEGLEELSEILELKVLVPKIGDKKKIVDLACKNSNLELETRKELHRNKEQVKFDTLIELGELLDINTPFHIEAFDNSNVFGKSAVSAMVCYKNGKPSKKDYRKFKIKTVEGPDDYASMKEVVYRRYYKVLMENLEQPDLIVIDGGKGQVGVALEVIDSLGFNIPVIGLKKDNKHKTESIIFNNIEIKIDKHSNIYKLLSNIQEEVDRFAKSYHKNVHSKGMYASILDSIEGVGEKRKNDLLKEFKSLEGIRNASIEEFAKIGINKELAFRIKNSLSR